jgi:hypothetical protein
MRPALVSDQKEMTIYLKDMTLGANAELGNLGACRRR